VPRVRGPLLASTCAPAATSRFGWRSHRVGARRLTRQPWYARRHRAADADR
jgi:hypothetical protein